MRLHSKPTAPPTVDGAIARRAVARCGEAGIDPLPLLAKADLTVDEINDGTIRLAAKKQVMLLNLAADALGDEHLGFHLAQTMDLREAGLLYFVLASSGTLGEALHRAERYSTITNEALRLERVWGEGIGIRYSCVGIERHLDRHQMELWLTALVRITRQLTALRIQSSAANIWFFTVPGSPPPIGRTWRRPTWVKSAQTGCSIPPKD